MRILLLDGETVQVVCMARALKKAGNDISSLCSEKCSSGYATRYVDHKFICPNIQSKEDYESYFYNHLERNKYDLIIPMFDTSAEFLSKNKETIEEQYGIKCAVPSFDLFNVANDKNLLMEMCEKFNINHPRTRGLPYGFKDADEVESDIVKVSKHVGFPSMIKPNLSGGAKGIVKVNNLNEIKEKLPGIVEQFGPCTLQQYVEQPDYYYNVMLYRTQQGEIAAYTIIKIRRFFPIKGGSSCYCETIEHPSLLSQCAELLNCIHWVGFADFDVLEDIHTGELKIIEINPRTPSSLQASYASGVDFGQIMIADIFNKKMPKFNYKTNQQVRWLGLDVMWFLFSSKRFSFKPSWFRFFGKNISYHDGTLCDPLPMLAGMFAGVIKYLNPQFRKSKLDN